MLNKNPLISILIANYNYGKYINSSIESALNQDIDNNLYEIVVIDDGSTDDSIERISQYKNQIKITKITHRGLPQACNIGITKCKGQFVVRLDSDDKLRKDFLSNFLQALNEREFDYFISNRLEIRGDRKKLFEIDPNNIYTYLSVGIVFKKEKIQKVSGYRNFYWEEHDLMLRYKKKYNNYYFCEKPLYMYNIHGNNMTASAQARINGWKQLLVEWGEKTLMKFGYNNELEIIIKK